MIEGTLLGGRFRVERALGHGSMGAVYYAEDTGLRRAVALKLVATRGADAPALVEAMRLEARTLASVRSEHVAQVYAFGTHGDAVYFAMEYVHGVDLETLLAEHAARRQQVAPFRAVSILKQVASGLDRVHARGLVHRDVKPANIVVEAETGRPVLIDFGLALGTLDPRHGTASGTPLYMAPEQIRVPGAPPVTLRADVYGLGCVAFELITGRVPFDGADVAGVLAHHLSSPVPRATDRNPAFAPFDPVFARALAKNPLERYASASALADALDAARREARDAVARTAGGDEATSLKLRAASPVARDPAFAATIRAAAPDRVRVLVVDDDPAFLRIAVTAAKAGLVGRVASVQAVASGPLAIAAAIEEIPRLVLLDFDMPHMNGIETLARLRDLPGGADMRVVVVSARAGEVERWQFEALGVRDFLDKPVPFETLAAKVSDLAKRARWPISVAPPGGG